MSSRSLNSHRSSPTPALLTVSAIVLAAAFMLRETRSQALSAGDAAATTRSTSSTRTSESVAPAFVSNPRAMRLLERTLRADNLLIYNADYATTVMFGNQRMTSKAHLERAPKRLNIRYLSGAREGLQLGFNERWFWRRDGEQPMQAYIEVALRPDEMVQRRFRVMRSNYGARLLPPTVLDSRPCDVVEVRRLQPIDGTVGPWKRLWIDRQTGLTLRTDSFNHEGKLVMRSQLSNLKVQRQIEAPSFVAPAKMVAVAQQKPWMYEEMNADRARVEQTTGIAPPQVQQLPSGFEFDSVGTHRFDSSSAPDAALTRYTDGFNVVTVFALKKSPEKSTASTCDFGLGTMAMRDLPNGTTLLAVGDLPAQTLQKMLDSTDLSSSS